MNSSINSEKIVSRALLKYIPVLLHRFIIINMYSNISKKSYTKVSVIVQVPQIVLQLVDQKADVKFSCIANGSPSPVIAWHFTNISAVVTVIHSTTTISNNNITIAELELMNITVNDFRNYSCVVVNKNT